MQQVKLTNLQFSNYSVTRDGNILSHKTNKFLKLKVQTGGYLGAYAVRDDGKSRIIFLHKALASGFIPNPDNLPHVNHEDGNKQNNSLDNLVWATKSYDVVHMYCTGLAQRRFSPTEVQAIRKARQAGESLKSLGAKFDADTTLISKICNYQLYKEV